jgi:aspartate kinase
MALVVQKFGGTSVGSIERILHVARWVLDSQAKGDDVVVVVSAMSGETNRLVELATQINPHPQSRAFDLLVASGEQVAVGLVTLAINAEAQRRGLVREAARGLLGHQIGIFTDGVYSKARIQAIDTVLLHQLLQQRTIPVIAGFQGVDPENNITTLGRGGSDTSAVAIAVALSADDCEIYTDVDGVYTTDPRICREARKIQKISYEEMMELASLGAKVLQIRSVELAAKFKLPLHVRSSFDAVEGTRVVPNDFVLGVVDQQMDLPTQQLQGRPLEQVVVAGVAADPNQVKFTLRGLPDIPGATARIFKALSSAAIVVDIIVQDFYPHSEENPQLNLSFTVGKADRITAREVLQKIQSEVFEKMQILEEDGLAKVSIVGVGMQHHPGVASTLFELLATAEIGIKLITTSEIKISCLVAESQMKRAVEWLHRGFGLDKID